MGIQARDAGVRCLYHEVVWGLAEKIARSWGTEPGPSCVLLHDHY